MKILALDIETRPSLAYIWSLWDDFVPLDRLIDSGEMISFGSKWIGEDNEVEFMSTFHTGKKKMVKRIWSLLDEADVVLHFNGKKFDVPHIQREFLELGLTPPSPFKQIDLLETCRSQFKFPSNKLEYVAKRLGLGEKEKHEGFQLWVKCMANDPEAWDRMKNYNIKDVELLEELYNVLRPWLKTPPSFSAHASDHVCPRCSSGKLQARGYAFLSTGKYQRYQCTNCGSWSRGTKRLDGTDVVSI